MIQTIFNTLVIVSLIVFGVRMVKKHYQQILNADTYIDMIEIVGEVGIILLFVATILKDTWSKF